MLASVGSQYRERISVLNAQKIAGLDYETFVLDTTDARKAFSKDAFAINNSYGYYIVANCWVGIASDLGGKGTGDILLALLRTKGLVYVSTILKRYSDLLVRAANDADSLWDCNAVVDVDLSTIDTQDKKIRELLRRLGRLSFPNARQICNFPKRFAPLVPSRFSALHQAAVNQFEEVNSCNCRIEYRLNSLRPLVDPQVGDDRALPFRSESVDPEMVDVAKLARAIVNVIVGEWRGLSGLEDASMPRFGPGACRNAGPSVLDRYERCVQYGYYKPSSIPQVGVRRGIVVRPHPDTVTTFRHRGHFTPPKCAVGYWGTSRYPQVCRVSSVPKTAWANRLIAIEDVCNQSSQLHLKSELHRCIAATVPEYIPITNQGENRDMARFAAYTNRWATLDLSHASDSVTKPLVQMLFPHSWWEHGFRRCVPFGYILSEDQIQPKPLHMMATMGCGCTFSVEALVFFALTVAAEMIQCGFDGHDLTLQRLRAFLQVAQIRVMGDDIICRTAYALSVIRVLEYFGFEVNTDKSFIEGRFRESCGADWLSTDQCVEDGVINVTCVYYPRIPIGRDFVSSMLKSVRVWSEQDSEAYYESGLARMIALQQRLYDLSPTASGFLSTLIREHFPDVSTSFPGEYPGTLWTNTPYGEYVYNVSDLADRSSGSVASTPYLVVDDGKYAHSVYADYAETTKLLLSDFQKTVGRQPSAAEYAIIREKISWRRRRVLRLPRKIWDLSAQQKKSELANILLLEQYLTRRALADDVIPVCKVHDLEAHARKMGYILPLSSVRPTRLSRAGLGSPKYTILTSVE